MHSRIQFPSYAKMLINTKSRRELVYSKQIFCSGIADIYIYNVYIHNTHLNVLLADGGSLFYFVLFCLFFCTI